MKLTWEPMAERMWRGHDAQGEHRATVHQEVPGVWRAWTIERGILPARHLYHQGDREGVCAAVAQLLDDPHPNATPTNQTLDT